MLVPHNGLGNAEELSTLRCLRRGIGVQHICASPLSSPLSQSLFLSLLFVSDVVLQTQDYSFMRYLPFLPVVYHLLFATPNYPKLKYPHASSDVSTVLVGCAGRQTASGCMGMFSGCWNWANYSTVRPRLIAHIRFPQKDPDRRGNRITEHPICCTQRVCCKSAASYFLPDGGATG